MLDGLRGDGAAKSNEDNATVRGDPIAASGVGSYVAEEMAKFGVTGPENLRRHCARTVREDWQ